MKTLAALCAVLVVTGAPKVEKIDAKSAAALVDKGTATLIDVREEEEVNAGMAKPAKWFPLSKVKSDPAAFKQFLGKLPKGKVIFYCEMGGRAGQAAEVAAQAGYTAANMGGISDWKDAGLPTREKP
jgi:rhodanese-related sulfurtransferase